MIKLTTESKECLFWWINNFKKAYRPILTPKPDCIIESDSSMTGYGAYDVTNGTETSGLWDEMDQQHHINFLELKAAFLALKELCEHVRNEHIQLFLDNTTAIKYLNKMGGRKVDLNNLTKEIWVWCVDRGITISVFHIPGSLNVRADALSRQKLNPDMEWMLDRDIFNKIVTLYGLCDIDMFASNRNYKLTNYVSYLPDPNAVAINAFSVCWNKHFSYLFPPFSCIGSVLQKIDQDEAETVLVAPLFSTQPWFPKLLQMVVKQPFLLPKVDRILAHPVDKSHPLTKMSLGVFRLSGMKSVAAAYQKTLPILSSIHGDPPQGNSMGHISKNGCVFVVKNRLINLTHL